MKTLRIILNPIYTLADIIGLNLIFRFINRKKAVVLWYHGVCDDGFRLLKGYDERHVPVSKFRRQLAYLKKKGYKFATVSEFYDIIRERKPINRLAILTFDDGFNNIVKNAYPVMAEYGAKGCFYLVSELVSTDNLLWTDRVETAIRSHTEDEYVFSCGGKKLVYRLKSRRSRENAMREIKRQLRALPDSRRRELMPQFSIPGKGPGPDEFKFASWEQVQSLNPEILEPGSHTVSHPNLTSLNSDMEYKTEINKSKAVIEKHLQNQVDHFCFPAGDFNDVVIEYVRECGYKTAVTTIPGLNGSDTDPFRIRRVVVTENFAAFKAYVSGFYLFLRGLVKRGRQ
jgi:peptidoglycan/xylan/chitin deacetylase (PgdA/CDA1 family)